MHDILTNLVGFVLVLGFLIFAHESGHFVAAKLFGVRVLVYSFGFGKRLIGFRRGDTDYRISLIPLGGYVRMAGDMSDERAPLSEGSVISGPTEFGTATGAPDEFLSKPKWQRFLILFAGPFMNLVIAVTFVAAVQMLGREELISEPIIAEVTQNKAAARAGLAAGDRIVKIGDEPVDDFDDVRLAVSMRSGTPVRVEYLRNGKRLATTLTPDREESDYGPVGRAGIRALLLPNVGRVTPGSPADRAGLRPGDRVVAVNGKPIRELEEFFSAVRQANGAPIDIVVQRGNERLPMKLAAAPLTTTDPLRGFLPPTKKIKLSLFPAIRTSIAENIKMLKYTVMTIGRLFRAEGSVKELSGPLSIARISGDMLRESMKEGPLPILGLMAMISLQLGFMNLLPIPVLDGGHIMVLLVEGVARRDLSLRMKERIQQVGFAALAALMIVVLYNDVIQNVLRFRKG